MLGSYYIAISTWRLELTPNETNIKKAKAKIRYKHNMMYSLCTQNTRNYTGKKKYKKIVNTPSSSSQPGPIEGG